MARILSQPTDRTWITTPQMRTTLPKKGFSEAMMTFFGNSKRNNKNTPDAR